IQILETEIRPAFAHAHAQKMVHRAQATVTNHQEKTRRAQRLIEGAQQDLNSSSTAGGLSSSLIVESYHTTPESRILVRKDISGTRSSQRIKIAPVTDTPNDEE